MARSVDVPVWAVLLLALAVRLAWVAVVPVVPFSDPAAYDTFARTISQHGVYGWRPDDPTAFWAVGAPAIYAFGYWLFGPSYVVVIALNLLATLAIVWATVRLGALWAGRDAGALAGLCVALWPGLIALTTTLNSELFFTALLLTALLGWTILDGPALRGAVTGVLLGLAALVRPVALLVPILLALNALARGGRWGGPVGRRALAAAAVAMLCLGLTIAPWTARNTAVFGEPVLISTNFGVNFWMGNNPDTTGRYQQPPADVAGLGEVARADELKARALAYIRDEPGAFLRRTLVKAAMLFRQETVAVAWNSRGIEASLGAWAVLPLKAIATGYWYVMILGAAAGLALTVRRAGAVATLFGLPVLLIGYFAALHGVIFVSDRFHMPLNPIIAILAAVAFIELLGRKGAIGASRSGDTGRSL